MDDIRREPTWYPNVSHGILSRGHLCEQDAAGPLSRLSSDLNSKSPGEFYRGTVVPRGELASKVGLRLNDVGHPAQLLRLIEFKGNRHSWFVWVCPAQISIPQSAGPVPERHAQIPPQSGTGAASEVYVAPSLVVAFSAPLT